jgi:hypothetical protein
MSLIDSLRKARKVSTPVIAVTTADQISTVDLIRDRILLNGETKEKEIEAAKNKYPMIRWDAINGFSHLNLLGDKVLDAICPEPDAGRASFVELPIALTILNQKKVPDHSIIVIVNAHRFINETTVVQAIMNLREPFKSDVRTLILLGTDFQLPQELTHDILILDEPLPTKEEVKVIVKDLLTNGKVEHNDDILNKAVDALRGLAVFPIEQAASLSVELDPNSKKRIVNLDELWHRKRKMIQQVKGLTMEPPRFTFKDLGGLIQAKLFEENYFCGPCAPVIVCFLDEIEKMMGGAGQNGVGDSSGTSQDQAGQLLTTMEKYGYAGQILVGPPGSGKSAFADAVAGTFSRPLICVDLGAAKGSLVGQSEQQIRAMMKAIYAIAGQGGAFFIATCNKLDVLSPELRRRFRYGIYFFDLPDPDERVAIGKLQTAKYKLKQNDEFWTSCEGWSGANIRDCCDLAFAMNMELNLAKNFIVPADKQDHDGIERLRKLADGKFLSASYEGTYNKDRNKKDPSNVKSVRTMDV